MAGVPVNPLRRSDPRSEVVIVEIHGIAARHASREQGPFILWDISDTGLRLWMPTHVRTGEVLRLTIAKPFVVQISADVRWCKPLAAGEGFHVGVRALDNLQRLEALHRALARETELDQPAQIAAP